MTTRSPHSKFIRDFSPPFGKPFPKITPVHNVLAVSPGAELCYVPGKETNSDTEYWYLSDDGTKAVLGPTGMLISVDKLSAGGLEKVISRSNAYGNFLDASNQAVVNPMLKALIDEVYNHISQMDFDEPSHHRLFAWDADKLLSRFRAYSELYDHRDIIPEYTDKMVLVKISEGCPRKCIYCPLPGPDGAIPLPSEVVKREMEKASELQQKYHSGFEGIMDEGFLNTTDILLFHLNGWADTMGLVRMFKGYFPNIQKIYSFMGVPSVNMTGLNYLKELYNKAEGINRVLIGIESADEATSRFLGKIETYTEKMDALMKLKEAGFKVKPIVQVGVVGEGFYDPSGNFVSSRQGLETTAKLMAEFLSYSRFSKRPDKILVSKYIPIDGTPLKRLHEEARLVRPYSSPEMAEGDINFFLKSLQANGIDTYSLVDLDYESALEGRSRILG